jgi:hypothetical protein
MLRPIPRSLVFSALDDERDTVLVSSQQYFSRPPRTTDVKWVGYGIIRTAAALQLARKGNTPLESIAPADKGAIMMLRT